MVSVTSSLLFFGYVTVCCDRCVVTGVSSYLPATRLVSVFLCFLFYCVMSVLHILLNYTYSKQCPKLHFLTYILAVVYVDFH